MNSQFLKKLHHSTYVEFFSENEIVISIPFGLRYTGNDRNPSTSISIMSKLPIRIYLGITEIDSDDLQFGSLYYYDTHEENFISTLSMAYIPYLNNLQTELNKIAKDILWDQMRWYRFSFLSEVSRGVLTWFESNIAALTAFWLFYLTDTDSISRISSLSADDYNAYLHRENLDLFRSFHVAAQFENILYWKLAWQHLWAPMIFHDNRALIMMHSWEKNHPPFLFSIDGNSQMKNKSIPLDFSIVYSGKPAMSDQIANTIDNNVSWEGQALIQLNRLTHSLFKDLPWFQQPGIYRILETSWNTNLLDDFYNRISTSVSVEIFYMLQKLYLWNYTENAIKLCIEALDKMLYRSLITESSSSSFQEFIKNLRFHFHAKEWLYAIVPLNTSIMWGSVCVFTPIEGFRWQFSKSVIETQKKFPDARVIYSSWNDGNSENGILIEQDTVGNKYSQFLHYDTAILDRIWRGKKLWRYENLITWDEDILFDTIKNKIIIAWVRLTSAEIHSQTTAIVILRHLFLHPNEKISAYTFGTSSYTLSRHEMNNKIIQPIIRQLLLKTGKKLHIELIEVPNGFDLLYIPSNISVAILQWFN